MVHNDGVWWQCKWSILMESDDSVMIHNDGVWWQCKCSLMMEYDNNVKLCKWSLSMESDDSVKLCKWSVSLVASKIGHFFATVTVYDMSLSLMSDISWWVLCHCYSLWLVTVAKVLHCSGCSPLGHGMYCYTVLGVAHRVVACIVLLFWL